MATQARFGRLPRSAPSLTATIVALAQEYERVRESNIVDAWKNGGEFEGKKVTDKMVMDWFKRKRSELDPGDPMWDYYDNQITQYEFAIENSKEELEYKRGKRTDAQMANFYHTWAGKLPTDSEAYREREKLAAAYADRAASAGRARGRAVADNSYANAVNAQFKKEYAYDASLSFLLIEARDRGILNDSEDLYNIDPSTADGREINKLWDEIATSPEFAEKRRRWTQDIRKNGDSDFNGDFSQDAFNSRGRAKLSSVNERIRLARKEGRQEDENRYSKDKGIVQQTKMQTSGFDETEDYEEARKTWITIFEAPGTTPLEADRATQVYRTELNRIKDSLESQKGFKESDQRLGAINQELRTLDGDEAPVLHWGGMFGPGGNDGGVSATETAQQIKVNNQRIAQLMSRDASGQPVFVLVKSPDGINPAATNDMNHAAAMWAVVRRDQLPPEAGYVVQRDHGDPRAGQIVTAIQPTPVFTTVTTTTTNGTTTKPSDKPLGYHLMMPDGVALYKFQDTAGNWLYTPNNPFGVLQKDGTYKAAPPTISAEGATINAPEGVIMPAKGATLLPSYANPEANKAMTASIGKSTYTGWLIAGNPKNNSAYTQTTNEILSTLSMEAGNDPKRFAAMVQDADAARAVYLGHSTEEQQRIRKNALNGVPNPVPLAGVLTKMGLKPEPGTSEAEIAASLTKGRTDEQIEEDIRRGNMTLGGAGPRAPVEPKGFYDDALLRKYGLAPTPPKPLGDAKTSPTSLGSDIPGGIAGLLSGILATVTGQAGGHPKVTMPGPKSPAPDAYGNPFGATTFAPKATAPRATTPKPKAPPKPQDMGAPGAHRPAPKTPTQVSIKPPSAKGYTVVKDSHGNWAYRPNKGGRAIIA